MLETILVTGGAGFIGSHVVDNLLAKGTRVVVLDNFNNYYNPQIKRKNIHHNFSNPNFSLIEADILDHVMMDSIFSQYKPSAVIHLAARAGVRPSIADPTLYYQVNVSGTLHVLESMRKHKCTRLVFASSSSVYGNRGRGPFAETDSTDQQVSPYGATKKSGELLCQVYAHLYSINTVCLRFFTAYGPRNRPDMACFLFTHAIATSKPITQFGNGDTGRDYTYIDDIVAGVISALDADVSFDIVNLGNSSPVLLKELIATIEEIAGKKAIIESLPMQPGDVQLTFADITKAKKLLNFTPKTDLKTGLTNLYDWYQKNQGQL